MRQIRCDFHIHSALSPCADQDMTPGNIVSMAKLKGLDVIAVTDHQCCGNVNSAMVLASRFGITVVPGMELETNEEIHSICLFPDLKSAMIFDKIVREHLPGIENRVDIFGEQLLFDENDERVGIEKLLLLTPCALSFNEAQKQVQNLGGVMYPAHVDRDSYSILTVMGEIPREYAGKTLEISAKCDLDVFLQKHPQINDFKLVQSSDAHLLEDISEPGYLLEIDEYEVNEMDGKYLDNEHIALPGFEKYENAYQYKNENSRIQSILNALKR